MVDNITYVVPFGHEFEYAMNVSVSSCYFELKNINNLTSGRTYMTMAVL